MEQHAVQDDRGNDGGGQQFILAWEKKVVVVSRSMG